MTSKLIENLKSFNRKERYHLLRNAFGLPFVLGDHFRRELGKLLDVKIPETEHFVAMDYHLDWIYAALVLLDEQKGNYERIFEKDFKGKDPYISASQEDIDLLVAFQDEGEAHVILIEAKGDTAWDTSQFESKITRLRFIIERVGKNRGIHYYFVLTSPNKTSVKVTNEIFKNANKEYWIEMKMGERELLKPTRCDTKGEPSQDGTHWKVERILPRGTQGKK